MPTYQYECSACGGEFEILQSIAEPKLKKCPSCKKLKLQRLIGTGSGIIFRGTGFYQTDYKQKSSAEKQSSCAHTSCGCATGKSEPASKPAVESKSKKSS